MPIPTLPLSNRSAWLVTLAASLIAALLNHLSGLHGDGRLTFILLWPAVIFAGYVGGWRHVGASAVIGAAAVILFQHPMTNGRTAGGIGAVVLFLFIAGCFAVFCAWKRERPGPSRLPVLIADWKVSVGGIIGACIFAWANRYVYPALGKSIPFALFYPLMALVGYLGGAIPVAWVAGIALISVNLWQADLAGADHNPAFRILCGVFAFIATTIAGLSEAIVRQRRTAMAGAAALRDLPEAQARFAAIAQTSPDALWIWDMNAMRLIFISRASEKLIGKTPNEICAQTGAETRANFHPDDEPIVDAALKALASAETGQTVEYEYRHRHRNGSWRWLRNRAGVFARNPDGAVAQIFGHSEDVTERRDAAERLAEQAAELARIAGEREAALHEREALLQAERAARGEAERANRLKDDFLATVSHELRTPLTAMLGWTAMLSENAQEAELKQGLEIISRNARAQRQLIEDLLDMSRIMSGKLRIEPKPVLLAQVVDAAIETVTPAAEARGVALVSQIEGCEEPIQADAERLQQIIWNLLSNGVKFTPAGGQVCVQAEFGDDEVTISVADTGQGMAPEFVPHVFERFRQEDGATTRKAGGLGLGLAIVKHLVDLHGGTIAAHSEGLGKGSVFTVTMPLHRTRHESRFGRAFVKAALAGSAPVSHTALAGRRLLVIDDEADTRSYLHRVLTERGAQVDIAENAAEGLRRTLEEKPDAVICDISMPGEDGYSFIRRLRLADDAVARATPAVALTALARAEDQQRALDAGFNEHRAKPVEPAELLALVQGLLKGTEPSLATNAKGGSLVSPQVKSVSRRSRRRE